MDIEDEQSNNNLDDAMIEYSSISQQCYQAPFSILEDGGDISGISGISSISEIPVANNAGFYCDVGSLSLGEASSISNISAFRREIIDLVNIDSSGEINCNKNNKEQQQKIQKMKKKKIYKSTLHHREQIQHKKIKLDPNFKYQKQCNRPHFQQCNPYCYNSQYQRKMAHKKNKKLSVLYHHQYGRMQEQRQYSDSNSMNNSMKYVTRGFQHLNIEYQIPKNYSISIHPITKP